MKVYTELNYRMLPDGGLELLSEKHFEYIGPVARCDRAADQEAENAEKQDEALKLQAAQNSAADRAQTMPFFASKMKETHALNPMQQEELSTDVESGIGGAAGASEENAKLAAARTRNASGFTKALDSSARSRMQTAAKANEGIGSQDVMGAKAENMAGAEGISKDEGLQLSSMGNMAKAQDEDINTQIQAGKSGWLQNLNQTVSTFAG